MGTATTLQKLPEREEAWQEKLEKQPARATREHNAMGGHCEPSKGRRQKGATRGQTKQEKGTKKQ